MFHVKHMEGGEKNGCIYSVDKQRRVSDMCIFVDVQSEQYDNQRKYESNY